MCFLSPHLRSHFYIFLRARFMTKLFIKLLPMLVAWHGGKLTSSFAVVDPSSWGISIIARMFILKTNFIFRHSNEIFFFLSLEHLNGINPLRKYWLNFEFTFEQLTSRYQSLFGSCFLDISRSDNKSLIVSPSPAFFNSSGTQPYRNLVWGRAFILSVKWIKNT